MEFCLIKKYCNSSTGSPHFRNAIGTSISVIKRYEHKVKHHVTSWIYVSSAAVCK